MATIRAFSDADLNVAKAAQPMEVHPNTVRYRLQQIATKTGHDPRTFTGLFDLLCILEITDTNPQP
jgi:DNA-binding PucR family transcriptional regulator